MRRNKIFRWLYFIILLIPIMFVFLPMINEKDNSFTTTYEIKTNTNLIGSKDILSFIIDNSYLISDNDKIYYRLVLNNEIVKKVIFYYIDESQDISFNVYSEDTSSVLFGINFIGLRFNNDGNIYFNAIYTYGDYDVYVVNNNSINFLKSDIDYAFGNLSYYFTSFGYNFSSPEYSSSNNFLPFYYETTYELETINTSIWYDFSVKMSDSFSFIGDFTEFVSDNIIDISNNDYVFFAFTYMSYIFVISLLWLFFEFLMFIINFTHKFMERFYE